MKTGTEAILAAEQAALREDRERLTAELTEANKRIQELHNVLVRKNAIIHLMSFGDVGEVNDINTGSLDT